MTAFLDNFVKSLTSSDQMTVAKILENATVSKSDLDVIETQLAGFSSNYLPLPLTLEPVNGYLSSTKFELNFREIFHRLSLMYGMSNLISLLIDTHKTLLPSQFKAIEDDLTAMEKLIDNYAFLLADNASYSYAFIEDFLDPNGMEQFNFAVPDRAAQFFSSQDQVAINTQEGTLTLSQAFSSGYTLTGAIINSNVSGFVASDNGLVNCLVSNYTSGWKTEVATPNPITSSLKEAGGLVGAQFILEFTLDQSSPASQISLVPFANEGIQIVQATVFADNNDVNGTDLLTSPQTLNSVFNLYFPIQSVMRLRLVVNQPTYNRSLGTVNQSEQTYQNIYDSLRKISAVGAPQDRLPTKTFVEPEQIRVQQFIRLFQTLQEFNRDLPTVGIPFNTFEPVAGSLSLESYIQFLSVNDWTNYWDRTKWGSAAPVIEDIFRDRMRDRFDLDTRTLIQGGDQGSASSVFRDIYGPDPVLVRPQPMQNAVIANVPTTSGGSYNYEVGFYYIGVGLGKPSSRGAFVSTPIPSPEALGKVRINTTDENYVLPNTDRDSSIITSIEYSVSDQPIPSHESDWIPILPIGTSSVVAERFFPNAAGSGLFRFPADPRYNITLYKNGYLLPFKASNNLIYAQNNSQVLGLSLPNGFYSGSDIFTVDYIPSGDQTTIDLHQFTQNLPLVTAYDTDGAGEGFVATGGRNSVSLSYVPYVDYTQVASSTYNVNTGMSPYQPVTVVFADGTPAINLTNYTPGGSQSSVTGFPSGFYYIQSGTTIMFNRAVTQAFRVYYQYIQNDVRVRVALRSNDNSFATPKVGTFQLKATTFQSDINN